MELTRRLLFRSELWEVARPRIPLTLGHLVVRLADPAAALTPESASDCLRCHHAARSALRQALGATAIPVQFSYQWHPLGDAIGEPAPESSTPTFHLFARWPGERTSPGRQLSQPAHHRVPPPESELAKLDTELRSGMQRAAASFQADRRIPGAASKVHIRTAIDPHGAHHTLTWPTLSGTDLTGLAPVDLLSMATELQLLSDQPAVTGLTCLLPEAAESSAPLALHAVARRAGESANPLLHLMDQPEVSRALL